MKKICSLLSGLLLVAGSAFAQKSYEINGSIKGLNNTNLYLLVRSDNGMTVDTLIAKPIGNKFKFSGQIGERRRTSLYIGEPRSRKEISFFLEPGKIKMQGNVDSLSYVSITGTLTNNELTETQRYLAPLYDRRSALSQKMRVLEDKAAAEDAKLRSEMNAINESINTYKIRFMETRPASELSHSYLYVLQDGLPTATAERIFNSFPAEWRNSREGKGIYTKLQANKTVAVGNTAPDFTSTAPDGSKIKLSDFKGKYVLLEFWAHWCVPCRAQHPHLKEVYAKFKDKGFTILQYSVDTKKDEQKWKDAIKQDGLVWPQTSDLANGQAPVAATYGVQPIPDSFLISPDGKILARRLSPKQLEETLSKLLK
ncbi:Thiol-disulfide oxidoreductase ResA [compost metagenome]